MPALLACYLGVVIVDRATKLWALAALSPGRSVPLTPFLDATLVFNRGAAFGMGAGLTPVLIGIRLLVALGVFWAVRSIPGIGRLGAVSLGLIGGGALGNLIDHFAYGHVVDFLDLGWFPVFNIADCGIVVGGIMLAAVVLLAERASGRANG